VKCRCLDRDGASSPLGDTDRDGADARAGGFGREQQDRQQSTKCRRYRRARRSRLRLEHPPARRRARGAGKAGAAVSFTP
jgi:hypothetical protein